MDWFNKNSLGHLVSKITGLFVPVNKYMVASQKTFEEVYENLEDIDKRVETLEGGGGSTPYMSGKVLVFPTAAQTVALTSEQAAVKIPDERTENNG